MRKILSKLLGKERKKKYRENSNYLFLEKSDKSWLNVQTFFTFQKENPFIKTVFSTV